MTPLSPLTDSVIARKYGLKSLEHKVENKKALQEEIGWPMEGKRALLCLPLGMSDKIGGPLFKAILPGILTLPVDLLIVGKGSSEYGDLFSDLQKKASHRIHIVENADAPIRAMYAAADMALFLLDPASQAELSHCLSYGVVPIAPEIEELKNYDPVQEAGDSFLFSEPGPWQCFTALVRALETFRFPFDWRTIQRHGMEKMERQTVAR